MNNCNDNTPAFTFELNCTPERAEEIKKQLKASWQNNAVRIPVQTKNIIAVRSIQEIRDASIIGLTAEEVIIKSMLANDIYPFTVTDQFGNEHKVYCVGHDGKYYGTKYNPENHS